VTILGYTFDTPESKYLLVLPDRAVMALLAKNMVRSSTGRAWMAVRDMDVAAQVIGFRLMRTKLLAFAVSSFYCGVAGALYAYAYLGTVEPEGFNLDLSFKILFMIIIGGVGSSWAPSWGRPSSCCCRSSSTTWCRCIFGDSLGLAGFVSNFQLIVFRRPDHLLPDRRARTAWPDCGRSPRRNCVCGPSPTVGYGRTDAVDGSVFPYAFPLVTTYQMQASAIVKFIKEKEKGSLEGKKIVFLYHDSAYGKEPIVALQEEAKLNKFELTVIPVAHPGNEQGAQWLKIRQEKPDYVIFWGWGVMNQTAIKAAQKVGFPRDRMIGSWWAGSEEDTVPAGDAAKGYMSATWNVAGKDVPLIADIEKVVYGAGQGNLGDKSKIGTILYNRGVSAAVLSVEAVRKAQEKYGEGKAMTGEQVRWGLENLISPMPV
jgi:hypothetical protein